MSGLKELKIGTVRYTMAESTFVVKIWMEISVLPSEYFTTLMKLLVFVKVEQNNIIEDNERNNPRATDHLQNISPNYPDNKM